MINNLTNHTILSYDDLTRSLSGNSREKFVDARQYNTAIITDYDKHDMKNYTGNTIFVRNSVAKKLAKVSSLVGQHGYRIKIVYGYRHREIQEVYFKKWKRIIKKAHPELSKDQLIRATHNFIAVPDVAGHPTGGAVDLTLTDSSGTELDMGTKIGDYKDEEKIKTFTAGLTIEQAKNRRLLHDLMIEQEFAPFYGEWWHFSYGDREWAVFYNKQTAIYGSKDLKF